MGVPVDVSVVSGSNQAAVPSAQFASQLIALVRDATGAPQAGITVTLTPPPSGASCTLVGSNVTNANGRVLLTATANATQGTYNVTFSVAGATSAQFVLKNGNAIVVQTGPVSGAQVTDLLNGTFLWSNIFGFVSASGPPATANSTLPNVTNGTNTLEAHDFASTLGSIPANATITQLTATLSQRCTVANGGLGIVGIRKTDEGSVDAPEVTLTTSFATSTLVNANTFGFTPANIASTLRIRAGCYNSSAPTQYQLQTARVNVTYTTPPTPPLNTAASPLIFCEA